MAKKVLNLKNKESKKVTKEVEDKKQRESSSINFEDIITGKQRSHDEEKTFKGKDIKSMSKKETEYAVIDALTDVETNYM